MIISVFFHVQSYWLRLWPLPSWRVRFPWWLEPKSKVSGCDKRPKATYPPRSHIISHDVRGAKSSIIYAPRLTTSTGFRDWDISAIYSGWSPCPFVQYQMLLVYSDLSLLDIRSDLDAQFIQGESLCLWVASNERAYIVTSSSADIFPRRCDPWRFFAAVEMKSDGLWRRRDITLSEQWLGRSGFRGSHVSVPFYRW